MQIIPVIDLKDGYVVHAKKGERNRYQRVQSILVDSAEPIAVLQAFRDKLGCSQFYIADLDAIQRVGNHYKIISEIVQQMPDIEMMVDAGINTLESAQQILNLGVHQLVIGSETLSSFQEFALILRGVAPNTAIFSIDLKQGKVLSESGELQGMDPTSLIYRVKSLGVKKFILLELAKVGTESGIAEESFRNILQEHKEITLLVGGGVKNVEDLIQLKNIGVGGALIATAFHNGKITKTELELI